MVFSPDPVVLTQHQPYTDTSRSPEVADTLSLTADDRQRSRGQYISDRGCTYHLHLRRGLVLRSGDRLGTPKGDYWVQILAKPEPVLTVTPLPQDAQAPLTLLKAAYHLGNRHVPLELQATCLRLSPDSVLEQLLTQQLHVQVHQELAPFYPETGAYHHDH